MKKFASALSEHPVPTEALGEVVGSVLEQFADPTDVAEGVGVDLAVLFVSPDHVGAVEDLAATVRSLLDPTVLLGCTAAAVVGGSREVEDGPGVALFAAQLPDAQLLPVRLEVVEVEEGLAVTGWPVEEPGHSTLLALADPFSFPGEAFLERANEQFAGLQVIGGLASAARGPGGNRLVLDDEVVADGAVGVLLDADVEVATVVSQGCRPVGSPYVVTSAERNVIHELGGKPALERVQEMAETLPDEDRELLRNGLHVGRVVDEHREEFDRGDFLVRNVTGVDQASGSLAIGDMVEVGHTVQFHVRDAGSADEDLREMLAGRDADAALLFTCNGRGKHLFGEADHDAGLVDSLLGPLPVCGMFCAGELGPVGGENFLHGFTASVALLRS